MIQVYYKGGFSQKEYSMVFDGLLDDGISDFVTLYRFINCKDYMKHVYYTFPRKSIIRFKELNDNDQKFRERFANI